MTLMGLWTGSLEVHRHSHEPTPRHMQAGRRPGSCQGSEVACEILDSINIKQPNPNRLHVVFREDVLILRKYTSQCPGMQKT